MAAKTHIQSARLIVQNHSFASYGPRHSPNSFSLCVSLLRKAASSIFYTFAKTRNWAAAASLLEMQIYCNKEDKLELLIGQGKRQNINNIGTRLIVRNCLLTNYLNNLFCIILGKYDGLLS